MSKRNKPNRKEDIIYLTLIDFFLQMLFLMMVALLFYIVYYWNCVTINEPPIGFNEDMVLVEKKFQEDGKAALAFIEANGGKKTIEEAIKKMKKGTGLPSCAGMDEGGHPKSIATLMTHDNAITLVDWQPEFAELATQLGKPALKANTQWGLKAFVGAWGRTLVLNPQCRYTVTVIERSGLVRPRDHVQSIFYAKIRR